MIFHEQIAPPILIMSLLECPVCQERNWVFFINKDDMNKFHCMGCKASMDEMRRAYEQHQNREPDTGREPDNSCGPGSESDNAEGNAGVCVHDGREADSPDGEGCGSDGVVHDEEQH